MKVLVVGSGGREHALVWKIGQSPLVSKLFCAPGNPGTRELAENVDVAADDIAGIVRFANAESIDLVVVGPEAPLCDGLADELEKNGRLCFGPSRAAAEIEGSKVFARELCRTHRIPGPSFWSFDDVHRAKSFLQNREDGPIVVKASGLAAGKGVAVCKNNAEALAAVADCLEQGRFGDAGATVVLEECLAGPEVSLITITDGRTIVPLEPARDHKPVFDGNEGPNTGGMGVVSPVDLMPRLRSQIENQVVFPAVHAMNRVGRTYRGFLYAGLMLTPQGPRVLEFNCRLGDPETQPLLMRFSSDLLPYLLAVAEGKLEALEAPKWDSRAAVCVVACSEGYPGSYPKGRPILGIDKVATGPDLQVFHAGTAQQLGGDLVTAGGRVLAVTGLGDDVESARQRVYGALEQIEFQGMHFRKDIGLPLDRQGLERHGHDRHGADR